MKRLLLAAMALGLAFGNCFAEPTARIYGKAPSLAESTAISTINSQPTKYKDQTVLLVGKAVDVCQHLGCWVELEAADSVRVVCRSLDESIHFPKDIVGKTLRLQGKVMYDAKASGSVQEKTEDGVAHACPAPKVMLSIDGAVVADLAEAPVPVSEPKTE